MKKNSTRAPLDAACGRRRSAPCGRRRRNPCGRQGRIPCGRRRSAPRGCRRRTPRGRRRRNPCGRQGRIPCGCCRPACARVCRGCRPSSLAPRARPSANGSARSARRLRKNYKVSTRPPVTLPLSPRVLKRVFPFSALNAQLTLFRVLVAVFEVCGNGDDGIC
jgi:hypothetical protein